jgi:hypothetical protein
LRKVELSEFRGKKLVSIREFYTDADGAVKPGRKGIALSIDQWKKLVEVADEINDQINE